MCQQMPSQYSHKVLGKGPVPAVSMTEYLKLHLQNALSPEGIHHLQLVGRNEYDTQQLSLLVVV